MSIKNMISYVKKYGAYTVRQRPFCPVDSLVLAELSYLKYDCCVSKLSEHQTFITLREIVHLQGDIFEKLLKGLMNRTDNQELLLSAAYSKRFGNTQIGYYENLVEPKKETQFSAMVFIMEKGYPFVAYRGTDESYAGWKEDFNMTYLCPVPAQERALRYLEKVAVNLLQFAPGFFVGGHSKGGNLALYAAINCKKELQNHLLQIFNLDGPGFVEDIYQREGYLMIQRKTIKLIPQSSIIGMLLENQDHYKVIRSNETGILQHDPFTWIVEEGDFIYLKELDLKSQIMGKTLYQWITEMTEEERKRIIDLLFKMLSHEKLTPLAVFSEDFKKTGKMILDTMKDEDEDTRKFVWDVMLQLIKIGTQNAFHMTQNTAEEKEE